MASEGKYPVWTKTAIEEKTFEQVNHFKYLCYEVKFLKKTNTGIKIQKFHNLWHY